MPKRSSDIAAKVRKDGWVFSWFGKAKYSIWLSCSDGFWRSSTIDGADLADMAASVDSRREPAGLKAAQVQMREFARRSGHFYVRDGFQLISNEPKFVSMAPEKSR